MSPTSVTIRSSVSFWLLAVAGALAGGYLLGLPAEVWLGVVVCLGLSWELYSSVTIFPGGVRIRPEGWWKAVVRATPERVVVEETYVVTGRRAPAGGKLPGELWFELQELDSESDDESVVIWWAGAPIDHGLLLYQWPELRAALLEMGRRHREMTPDL